MHKNEKFRKCLLFCYGKKLQNVCFVLTVKQITMFSNNSVNNCSIKKKKIVSLIFLR